MSGSNPLSAALSQVGTQDITKSIQNWGNILQLKANQTAGAAYQNAIDPQTGEFDANKFRQNLQAAGPAAAMAAGTSLANTQQISSDQLNQARAKTAWVNSAAGSLTRLGPNITQADVIGTLHQGVTSGVLTEAEFQRQVAEVGALGNDPAKLNAWANQHQFNAMTVDKQLDQTYGGTGTTTGPGGALIGYTQRPASQGGGVSTPPQQGAPQGLAPGQTAAYQQWLQTQVDWTDPTNPNVTKHGTNAQRLTELGVPSQYIFPGGAPATPGTQPSTSPLGTGRLPPALQSPNKPSATTAAPNIGSSAAGPTPEQAAGAAATVEQGKLGPPQFQAEAAADTKAQNQQAILGNMLSDTSQFTTGPLAGIVGKVRNLAGNLGVTTNTDAQSAKESFNKLAAGLADAQGAGSDARLNVNISANPHEELSPAGVDLILRQLQGNADYIRARASLAAKYTPKSDYPGFQQSVSGLDPRVFQMARMTADQRQTYWKSLDSNAQKQIDAAGREAQRLGVLGG